MTLKFNLNCILFYFIFPKSEEEKLENKDISTDCVWPASQRVFE